MVDHQGIAPATARALAAARWPHLTTLGLRGVGADGRAMGDEGARALLAVPWLGQLTQLELGTNCLGDAGARALAASPRLARLQTLSLDHNGIGDEGARALGHIRR